MRQDMGINVNFDIQEFVANNKMLVSAMARELRILDIEEDINFYLEENKLETLSYFKLRQLATDVYDMEMSSDDDSWYYRVDIAYKDMNGGTLN